MFIRGRLAAKCTVEPKQPNEPLQVDWCNILYYSFFLKMQT